MARKSRCETIKIKIQHVSSKDQDRMAISQGYQTMIRLIAEVVVRDLQTEPVLEKDRGVTRRVQG